jgi:alpha-beta hydrolase superfamily lysophospholipase
MRESAFKLSDPSATLAPDPVMLEYLRCYELPQPPSVRYGFLRFNSPQPKERIGLFGQAWVPPHAIGTVLLIHGYSEHTGNYARLIRDFVQARLAVVALDLRGHGLSEGPRGHLADPHHYAEDIESFLSEVFPQTLPHRPLYLFGHSLGGLIGLQLLLRGRLPVTPSAAIFTSPLLGLPELSGSQKILGALAPLVAMALPTLPIDHGISPQVLSHDEEYLGRRLEDPLIGRNTTPRWFLAVKKAVAEVQAHAKDFQSLSPTLFLLAGEEKVTNLNEARKFAFHAYGSLKHKVVEFPGYYHELEKERGVRDRVISEAIAWIRSHH